MDWDLSCKDWQERIRAGQSLIPVLPLFKEAADRAVAIFNKLRIPDIPARPRLEEAAGEWFREIVAAMFGCVDPVTRRRVIRELFLLIAKKNSKTTYGAGMMLTALLVNPRPRVEFHLIGPTQGISDLAFDQAVGMIEADDIKQREINGREGWLKRVLHVQQHQKRITYRGTRDNPGTGARLRIKTFSEEILTGPRPAGVLLDEIHLLGKDAKAASIVGQLRGGMVSNLEAFIAMLTTQSDQPPAGVFLSELTRARMIRDGEMTGSDMLPILYEFPDEIMESEAWRDSVNWPMVNPNLGRSVDLTLLKSDWEKAQIAGAAEIRRWASQHLNIQIGVSLKSNAWKGAKHWEKNTDPAFSESHTKATREEKKSERLAEFAELLAVCEVVTIGADGGGLDDLFGLFVLGRERGKEDYDKRRWRCWSHAWCFRSVLDERKDIAPRLLDFEQDGDLTIIDEAGDDTAEIADLIMQVDDAGLLPDKNALGVDQVGIAEVIEELARRGFDTSIEGHRVIGIPQGWKLNGAIKTTERRLSAGRMKHNDSKMMLWVLGNARVTPRGNAVSIDKQVSGTAKIDPLMAGFNAVVLMGLNPEPPVSVYDRLSDEGLAQSDSPTAITTDEEAAILRDPSHPRWKELRDAFEARLSANDTEESA
jgi:phage terminase large subunit-like protein